jgi:hypothetical protein
VGVQAILTWIIDCEAMIGHWDETASFVAALPEIFIMILVLIFPDEDPSMSTSMIERR